MMNINSTVPTTIAHVFRKLRPGGCHTTRRIQLIFLTALIGCLSVAAALPLLRGRRVPASSPKAHVQRLPDDVDMVMERYRFRESGDNLSIDISGKRVAHRGRKVLGLRSNLLKTTYIEDLRGEISGQRTRVRFSAADAEWDTTSTGPLVLHRDVVVNVNNRQLADLKSARIYVRQGVLEVTGVRKEVFQIK